MDGLRRRGGDGTQRLRPHEPLLPEGAWPRTVGRSGCVGVQDPGAVNRAERIDIQDATKMIRLIEQATRKHPNPLDERRTTCQFESEDSGPPLTTHHRVLAGNRQAALDVRDFFRSRLRWVQLRV